MESFFGGLGAPMMLLVGAFVGITALLWFLLPFSVFGIKARLDEEIELLGRIEQQLKSLNQSLADVAPHAPVAHEEGHSGPATPQGKPTDESPAVPGREVDALTAPARADRWQRPG